MGKVLVTGDMMEVVPAGGGGTAGRRLHTEGEEY